MVLQLLLMAMTMSSGSGGGDSNGRGYDNSFFHHYGVVVGASSKERDS